MDKVWRHRKLFSYIRELVKSDDKVLEIGPGDGTMLKSLFDSGVKNISFVDKKIYVRYPEIQNLGTGLTVNLDNENIPLADSAFDFVIALQVLEHLENPWHFSRECQRLLKSGGILVLSIPYAHNLRSKIRFLFKGDVMRYEKHNEHISFFTNNIFHKLFLKDFVLEKIIYTEPNLKQFGLKIGLPHSAITEKLFSTNINYILKKK